MKVDTVYESKASGRQWKKAPCGTIYTRGNYPGERWRESGYYGVPVMSERDVNYYIETNQFIEVQQ